MAFFDWNKDGEIDLLDAFLEYNIFKACTEEEEKDEFLFDADEDLDEDEE